MDFLNEVNGEEPGTKPQEGIMETTFLAIDAGFLIGRSLVPEMIRTDPDVGHFERFLEWPDIDVEDAGDLVVEFINVNLSSVQTLVHGNSIEEFHDNEPARFLSLFHNERLPSVLCKR